MITMKSYNEQSISWLLNLIGNYDPEDLQHLNMRQIEAEELKNHLQYQELQVGLACTFNLQLNEFVEQKFILYPNVLITIDEQNNYYHLLLSNCTIQKQQVAYKESQAFGMSLQNHHGNTFLFFPNYIIFHNWYKFFKQQCKLEGFLQKFKIGERQHTNFYKCMKIKVKIQKIFYYLLQNQYLFSVQIYRISELENYSELDEALQNEIIFLRSTKHQNLLQLKRVYEDESFIYIVYDLFQADSLFKLVMNRQIQHQVQIASVIQNNYDLQIIFQILQVLKFLAKHQFYHGAINPQNVLINSQNQMLQIILVNLSYRKPQPNDRREWLLQRTVESFIAPEYLLSKCNPGMAFDAFGVGALMYFIAFYQPQLKIVNIKFKSIFQSFYDDSFFSPVMESFIIDHEKITQLHMYFTTLNVSPDYTDNEQIISISQLDLMEKLINLDTGIKVNCKQLENRLSLKQANQHHWFVNMKCKIKSSIIDRKKKKYLPSLLTIIELREQSELEYVDKQDGMDQKEEQRRLIEDGNDSKLMIQIILQFRRTKQYNSTLVKSIFQY